MKIRPLHHGIPFSYLLFLAACSSSGSGTPTKSDAGPSDSGADAATCEKLPPAGPSQVVQPALDGSRGLRPAMTLSKKGWPVFAYLEGPSTTASLFTVAWDGCAGAWKAPVKVDDSVPNEAGYGATVVSIATDASDGRIVVAYNKTLKLVSPPRVNNTRAAFLATSSDDGNTFTSARISKHGCETNDQVEGDINDVFHPVVAAAKGVTYVSYTQAAVTASDYDSALLLTIAGGTVSSVVVQDRASTLPGAIAVDSEGTPAVVTTTEPANGYNRELMYVRPGGAGVKVSDTNNVQNDENQVALAFDGKKPRIVSRLKRGSIGGQSDYDMVFYASDDGKAWSAPLALPKMGSTAPRQAIVAQNGSVTIFAGGPRLLRSSDLANFTIVDLGLAQEAKSPSAVLDARGKGWFGFEGTSPKASAVGGVVLYREP